MKLFFTLFFTLCLYLHSVAQVEFDKGYIIDINGNKKEGLIRNQDWGKAPEEFKYKLNESGPVETGTTSTIKEFYIDGYGTFRSADVDVDQSPTSMYQLSAEKNPIWQRKQLFLEVLVDGKAALYFNRSALASFFFSVNNGEIKQLIRKQYRVEGGSVATNNAFRQQLLTNLVCRDANLSPITLAYTKKELIRYFQQYNQCADPNFIVEKKIGISRDVFKAHLFAGINSTSLSLDYRNTASYPNVNFPNKMNVQLGLDFELILPVQKNKWSVTTDIKYQQFKSDYEDNISSSAIDVSFFRWDFGIRHYFFLNSLTKIHALATVNFFNYLVDGEYGYTQSYWTSKEPKYFDMVKSSSRVTPSSLGLGITRRRIGLEARYNFYDFVIYNTNYKAADMKGTTLSLKYAFLTVKTKN